MKRTLEDPDRAPRRAGRPARGQHDHRRWPDQGSRGDDRGRPDPQPAGRRGTGLDGAGRRPPTRLGPARSCSCTATRARCSGGTSWLRSSPRDHRVIRLDLLGHGGSQKPSSGYSIEDQAGSSRAALDQLGVQGAVVVGHSMGVSVATALAERSSQLVDRLGEHQRGADRGFVQLPFMAKLAYARCSARRVAADPELRDRGQLRRAFAPGFERRTASPNPDQVVDDLRAMTYTGLRDAAEANADYIEEIPLERAAEPGSGTAAERFSAPRTRSAIPRRSRRPTGRSPALGSLRSRAPGTHPTSRSPRRPRR